jgi:hypothetical protein
MGRCVGQTAQIRGGVTIPRPRTDDKLTRTQSVDFHLHTLGDWASVVGLIVSFFGLAWTIKEARAAKRAAEHASKIADETKERLFNIDAIGELSIAVSMLQEIMRLQNMQRGIASRTATTLWR